jgi:hypothetical protein
MKYLHDLGFQKTALTPELYSRASEKAEGVAKMHTNNFRILTDLAKKQPEHSTRLLATADNEKILASKKMSQSIKFLMGAHKI